MKFVVILLQLVALQSLFAADHANWFNLQEPSQFQNLIARHLQPNALQLFPANVSFEQLKVRLTAARDSKQSEPIFIHCSLEDYAQLLHDPDAKALISDLQLEFLNAQLVSVPLYLLGYADSAVSVRERASRTGSVQVAFLTLPGSEVYGIEEADLLTMISEILSRPKSSIRIYREREAYTAAKQLFDGRYNLVGIYDDEPSTLFNELQINLVDELKAHAARLLDIPPSPAQLHEVSPRRFAYVFVISNEDPSIPVPAIVQQSDYPFPILLSNIRRNYSALWPQFSRALSDAYFLTVADVLHTPFASEQQKQSVIRAYLLNAYLNDPEDRYKSLGFLGYLLLLRDRKWDNAHEKDIYDEKCALFLKKLKLNRITAEDLFAWLNLKVPKIDKRELFTDDVSRLYQNAMKKIDDALRNKEKRKENLEAARQFLIAALMIGDRPKVVKGSRGLWSVPDYNPYYQLARVTLYLKEEK